MANTMNDVLEKANVAFCKSTHLRTQAVQYASSRGLASDQINTITKHILDKLNSAYQPEVEEECMKVMSGFREVRFLYTIISGCWSMFILIPNSHPYFYYFLD
jgi:hypothetical protein